jgi:hypothetical protein
MCEMATPGATPVMLVATSAGKIYQYPVGTADDGNNYAAQWRGYFGQERLESQQQIEAIESHNEAGVGGKVTMTIDAMDMPGQTTVKTSSAPLQKTSFMEKIKALIDRDKGRMFRVQYASDATCATGWTVSNIVVKLNKFK